MATTPMQYTCYHLGMMLSQFPCKVKIARTDVPGLWLQTTTCKPVSGWSMEKTMMGSFLDQFGPSWACLKANMQGCNINVLCMCQFGNYVVTIGMQSKSLKVPNFLVALFLLFTFLVICDDLSHHQKHYHCTTLVALCLGFQISSSGSKTGKK